MKYSNCTITIFVMVLLISISITTVTYANSAEPPSFTVIVSNPAEDLSLSIQFPDKGQAEGILLNKEQKAWETYYRFFYHMSPGRNVELEGTMLIVKSFQCSCRLPHSTNTIIF